jgi:two-component system LytT family response regulator
MNKTVNAIIVEDMPIAVEHLRKLLTDNCPNVNIIASYPSATEAIKHLPGLNYDLLFLDIEYNDGYNAFNMLDNLDFRETHIIFTTAFEHYRKEAAEVDSIKYLLKPIKKEELIKAVERSMQIMIGKEKLEIIKKKYDAIKSGKLTVNSGGILYFIEPEEIVYLEAEGAYTYIYYNTGNDIKKVLSSQNIGKYELTLNNGDFLRVHKKYLINTHFVKNCYRNKLKLSVKDKTFDVLISKDRRKEIIETISLNRMDI